MTNPTPHPLLEPLSPAVIANLLQASATAVVAEIAALETTQVGVRRTVSGVRTSAWVT